MMKFPPRKTAEQSLKYTLTSLRFIYLFFIIPPGDSNVNDHISKKACVNRLVLCKNSYLGFFLTQEQGFSTVVLLTSATGQSFVVKGCLAHSRRFSSNLGLYPLSAIASTTPPPGVTIKKLSRHRHLSPGGQNHIQLIITEQEQFTV